MGFDPGALKTRITELAKLVAYRAPLLSTLTSARYSLSIEPNELLAFMDAIKSTEGADCDVMEIGVAPGKRRSSRTRCSTTSAPCGRTGSWTRSRASPTRTSTTRCPTAEKARLGLSSAFRYNDSATFMRKMRRRGFTRVRALVGDVGTLAFPDDLRLGAVLIDVDVFSATLAALEKTYERLAPNAVIIVDDVQRGGLWDGAYYAFFDFVGRTGCEYELLPPKGGLIRKRA